MREKGHGRGEWEGRIMVGGGEAGEGVTVILKGRWKKEGRWGTGSLSGRS